MDGQVAERQLGLIDKPKRRPVRKPVGRKIDGDKWPSSEPLLRSPEKRKTPARAASAVVRTPVRAAGKGWSAGKVTYTPVVLNDYHSLIICCVGSDDR